MNKVFNTSGDCKPDMHYMVDIEDRLIEMKAMVDRGDYFTVNFVVNRSGNAVVSNRIFETILYNWFLSEETMGNEMHKAALQDKNQFILIEAVV